MPDSNRIDSHQHFWQYNAQKHDWIDDEMAVIRRDFLPQDLEPLLQQNGISGCVAVQADQTEADTDFLLQLASEHAFIKGVVGWVDLRADVINERLAHYAQFSTIKGFRHVLQGEAPEFMLQPNFKRGIAALQPFGFTYDLLIFPQHLKAAIELVRQFPDQPFVIDHIAKPQIKAGILEDWQQDIIAISQCENVNCKISGMVTEAEYHHWKPEDFTPYLDTVVAAFGPQRIMFGSDWPVCQVAGSYDQILGIAERYFSTFSIEERALFFGGNATKFYRL
ncbi:MAG: amidohydrolase family protein [Chitinophagaceae bacterium]